MCVSLHVTVRQVEIGDEELSSGYSLGITFNTLWYTVIEFQVGFWHALLIKLPIMGKIDSDRKVMVACIKV